MRNSMVVIGVVLAMALIGCAPPVDTAADRKAVEDAVAAVGNAVAQKDVEGMLSFYAEDAVAAPPCGQLLDGTGIREIAQVVIGAGGGFEVGDRKFEVASGGGMVYEYANYTSTMQGPDGQPVTIKGIDAHLWVKQADGSWKIVHDIWTSDTPMCEGSE